MILKRENILKTSSDKYRFPQINKSFPPLSMIMKLLMIPGVYSLMILTEKKHHKIKLQRSQKYENGHLGQ